MICKNCGNFIPPESFYCTRCGKKSACAAKETLNRFKANNIVQGILLNPYEFSLFVASTLIFIFTLTHWIKISPDFITLTSVFEAVPFFAGLSEMPQIIRNDYSILDIVNLFFTMFSSLSGVWVLPFFALFLLVAGFSILLSNALFVIFLHSNSKHINLLGKLAYLISMAAALTPFLVSFLLNSYVTSQLKEVNFPVALLDVRLFSVTISPCIIIVLCIAGLVLLKKIKKKGD